MGPWVKYTDIANSSSSNSVADIDGTMTALSVEWMEEDLKPLFQFPFGGFGVQPSSCPMPAHRSSHNDDD